MADLTENMRVKMVRKDLENIPQFTLPPGYSFRAYRQGDEEHWLRIQLAADRCCGSRRRDGRFDVASLRAGEFIVEPGLVYRLEGNVRASRKAA